MWPSISPFYDAWRMASPPEPKTTARTVFDVVCLDEDGRVEETDTHDNREDAERLATWWRAENARDVAAGTSDPRTIEVRERDEECEIDPNHYDED